MIEPWVRTETAMMDKPPANSPSPRQHREMIAVAIGILIFASVMEIRDDQRVAFRGWSAFPLPELCTARSWFGTTCPGCGLTRGMIRLAHAEWSAALEVHRLSGLMAFAILLQIPYRITCLRTGRLPFGTVAPKLFGRFLIGALFLNWAVSIALAR